MTSVPTQAEMQHFACPHGYCKHLVIDHASPIEARNGCLVGNCECSLNNFEVLHFLFIRKLAEQHEHSFTQGHGYGRASLYNEIIEAIDDGRLEYFVSDVYRTPPPAPPK